MLGRQLDIRVWRSPERLVLQYCVENSECLILGKVFYELEKIQKKGTRMQTLLKVISFNKTTTTKVEGAKLRVGKNIPHGNEARESRGLTFDNNVYPLRG